MPSKRKKSGAAPKSDMKITAIMVGLFAAAVLLFLIFSKARESKEAPNLNESSELPSVIESNVPPSQPVEVSPPAPAPVENENVSGSGGKIAFIIDDWGYTMANCKYLKDIPEPLAVSILPGLRHTKDIANCAAVNHKVAMLHLPLQAMANSDYYPPNYIIKTTMPAALVNQIVEGDLDQLPSIEGVNNHMGSKATADPALMRIIFKKLKKRDLFFVDSMTSSHSVSARLAGEMGLSFGKRDVFLDNVNTREAITRQIVILAQKARRRGYAVAIGHDRHLTMQVLKDEIPWLEKQGFTIVSIKDLLQKE